MKQFLTRPRVQTDFELFSCTDGKISVRIKTGITEKTSTLNKTCRRYRKNDERPTGMNTTKWMGRRWNLKINVRPRDLSLIVDDDDCLKFMSDYYCYNTGICKNPHPFTEPRCAIVPGQNTVQILVVDNIINSFIGTYL